MRGLVFLSSVFLFVGCASEPMTPEQQRALADIGQQMQQAGANMNTQNQPQQLTLPQTKQCRRLDFGNGLYQEECN